MHVYLHMDHTLPRTLIKPPYDLNSDLQSKTSKISNLVCHLVYCGIGRLNYNQAPEDRSATTN